MKKGFQAVFLWITISLFLTACFPTGYQEKMTQDDTEEELSMEEINSSENENIIYDFDRTMDAPEECGIYSVFYRPWDEEEVRSIFFGSDDKGIYSHEYHLPSQFVEGDSIVWHAYELADGRYVCCDAGTLTYYTQMGRQYQSVTSEFSLDRGDDKTIRKWLPEEKLEAFSADAAKKQLEEIIARLELPADQDQLLVYAIDQAAIEKMGDWGNIPEAYMLVCPVKIGGASMAPMLQQYISFMDVEANGSYVIAIFSKEGLESFEFCNPVTKGELLRTEKICSKMQAIRNVKEYINSMAFQGGETCEISGGKLQYVYMRALTDRTGQFEIHPYWIFQQKGTMPDGFTYYRAVFVDAVTGQTFIK